MTAVCNGCELLARSRSAQLGVRMCGIIGIYKYEVCWFFAQQAALFAQPHLLAKYKYYVLF